MMNPNLENNIAELAVCSKLFLGSSLVELELTNSLSAQLPDWKPGSHIELKLPNGLNRQYSLLKGRQNINNWRIAVLIEEQGRGGSKYLRDSVEAGDVLEAVGPRNNFPLEPAEEYLFIAGGIGVTPLIQMCEEAEQNNIPWKLFYLGRSFDSMAYADELTEKYPNKVELVVSGVNPRLDVPQLLGSMNPYTHVYSCGPERLMSEIESVMEKIDINRVHLERFHPREILLTEPDHEFVVYCQKSDVELTVPADESIFMAADFEGIEIPGDCMEGTCGTCETRVFEGEIDHRDSVLTAAQRNAGDTMMVCVSRAKGNRLVIDL